MSAETIPAEVVKLARRVVLHCQNTPPEEATKIVERVIASAFTRPAEPAAPVAEVKAWLLGDPATGQWIEVDGYRVEYSRGMGTPAHVLASAFQAERARADAAEQRAADALARVKELEFGAGFEAAFDAVVRPGSRYENWTPADDPAEIVTDLYNELEDALARAEKAEGALEMAREDTERLDYLDRCNQALNAHYGTTYRWELVQSHNVNRLMLGHMVVDLNDSAAKGLPSCRDAIDRARRRAALARSDARASREAQPATDGGDNG